MYKEQNFQIKNLKIREQYLTEKRKNPKKFMRRLDLSWSIWMFGIEPFENSLKRLKRNGLNFVEIKGDTSISIDEIKNALKEYDMRVSGACGLFPPSRDLSSTNQEIRENAIEYLKNLTKYVSEVGGRYIIVVPSAVGRNSAIDSEEFSRSVQTLKRCSEYFDKNDVVGAIEPIRSAEVSLIHTVDDALEYINAVNESSFSYINGDIYHMLNEEKHIGEAILKCGERLINLHIADSNRDAPGKGMIDIDTVIMAAYIIGMNEPGRFLTFEPLGPYPDPYVLSSQKCMVDIMDNLVKESVAYFKERENIVRALQ
ncbi:sugar phosphate isomerase [Kosmotoga arenicorallina S304]|uniref:Sugar phosphate isomerase n=1 Tax=Kosmotoga arenicorallina S304 TaxID=1453497 RepID=A0A176JZH3_9BACT|nr:sugar phosphate isomerase/epimerase family protein [Kosmotoga arenicorallina]OAA29491.1 sugar phosphate isomerase [Kosmotoga arenicorallina S304]